MGLTSKVSGSRRWAKGRRAASLRYARVYGYVTEERLRRWRQLRQINAQQLREALDDSEPEPDHLGRRRAT